MNGLASFALGAILVVPAAAAAILALLPDSRMGARLNVGPGPDGARRPDAESAVLGHIGGVAGFRSAVWHVPESDITIAISLNQADIDPNILARDILDLLLTWQGR